MDAFLLTLTTPLSLRPTLSSPFPHFRAKQTNRTQDQGDQIGLIFDNWANFRLLGEF
jgi:hypothetical protein